KAIRLEYFCIICVDTIIEFYVKRKNCRPMKMTAVLLKQSFYTRSYSIKILNKMSTDTDTLAHWSAMSIIQKKQTKQRQ
ncbi:hypothetical protein BLOT_006718, partial [Blomia tropicalis]